MATKPKETTYKSAYQSSIDDLVNKAINRQEFQYDPATDAAYQSYARQYTRLGNEAAQNTLADVAAQTGGMPSSYAVTAASQARGNYNQALTDQIPSLMQAAYEKYRGDYNDTLAGIGTLQGLDDSAYGRFATDRGYRRGVYESDRDYEEGVRQYEKNFARSAFESDRAYDEARREFEKEFGLSERQFDEAVREFNMNFNRSVYESDRDFEEAKRQFEKNFGLSYEQFQEGIRQYEKNFEYQRYRDTVGDEQWQQTFNEDARRYNQDFEYQQSRDNVADRQWQMQFDEDVRRYGQDFAEQVRQFDLNYNLDKEAAEFEKMLNTWTTLGYANKKVAKYFGIKQGTKTNEAAYQAATLALDRARGKSGGSGGKRTGGSGGYYYTSKEDMYGPYIKGKDGTKETSASGLELDLYKDSPYNQALDIASRKLLNGASTEQVINYLNTVKGLTADDIDKLKQALGLGGNKEDHHKYKDPYTGTTYAYNF